MEAKTLKYYEWDEIQAALCERLGIEGKQFRDYAGKYSSEGVDHKKENQDFWHVWLWLIDDRILNDSWMPFYWDWEEPDVQPNSYFIERITERFGDWALDIVEPLNDLMREIDFDYKGIVIHYGW